MSGTTISDTMSAATMPPVGLPQFDGTVFVSYARADDIKPPFEESSYGWVTFFWYQLRYELTNAGVAEAELWLDRYNIEPSDEFTPKIEEALKKAHVIVPILSPNWVQRPWCRREIERFCELNGASASTRIELVVKRETPGDAVPPALQGREGHRFYELDESGKPVEFYWRGLRNKEKYFEILKRISDTIAARLILGPRPSPPVAPAADPGRRAVFLSVSADLQDARQRLANDLAHAGFAVLPEDGRLPDDADQAASAVEAMLQHAEMSVHLLGEAAPGAPAGGAESLAHLQMRLAQARASAAGAGFGRVFWAPKWLPGHSVKRDPFDVVRQFGGDPAGAEVFGEEVTNLSQWLRNRLTTEARPGERGDLVSVVVVAAAGPEDDELAAELANRVQGNAVRVHAMFHDDPAPPTSPMDTVAVLIPWGGASLAGLDDRLATLTTLTNQLTVLRLPGGDEAAKRRFFREGVMLERLAALPSDKQAARALLTDLEIVRQADRSGS